MSLHRLVVVWLKLGAGPSLPGHPLMKMSIWLAVGLQFSVAEIYTDNPVCLKNNCDSFQEHGNRVATKV